MTTIAYIRVSTVDQNTDRQLDGVEFDKAFTDKCSGGSLDRPQLDELRGYIREGDTVVVHSIDRLARNIDDLRGLVAEFRGKGVNVTFVKEGLTFTADDASPMAELMLNMLGAVAQFERSMIRERQQEGIAKAKAKGVYSGRKASADLRQQVKHLLEEGVSMRKIAAQVGCSLSTVQRVKAG
ncbi:recombinase family protein [Shewanella eurypsychrophilus]|uniref:Recombinase family protein n=1 Tax=Shewanella eurypsychrophilus TaxID=2593656 RepID=A0ABX6V9U3_9GAMM|nr:MULTISPECIES: recombinase family protein [Shewanella]QFU23001.1 helix-turn-helix domain-containing protein [Shewanella sp. YLB-09]QPG58287.1 recombinase family protein [Shewanella eurypsychrophilus]